MVFTLICMPTIHKSRDLVALTLSTRCSPLCQTALMPCLTGCDRIGYSQTPRRPRYCGVRHLAGVILLTTAVMVGVDYVTPSSADRDLGIMIDSDVSMRSHVSRTVSGCFATLRQIRSIRRSVSVSVFTSRVVSLIMPRLHYGNATLAGLPEYQHRRLQLVLNAAARLPEKSVQARHTAPACEKFTGCGPESVSTSNSPSSYSGVFMVLRRATYPTTYVASPTPIVGLTGCPTNAAGDHG